MGTQDEDFAGERGGGLALQTKMDPAVGTSANESNRLIAEIQAQVIVAQNRPRNPVVATERIMMAFTRPRLAQAAMYQYPRGRETVTGPSIRAAEAMALSWGNMKFGMRELEQRYGESSIYAYAWDLETNVIEDRTFQVSHKIGTRRGMKMLEDPREIYENNANMAARRMRACILAVLPNDLVAEVIEQVDKTLQASVKITPKLVTSLIEKFEAVSVPKDAIERYMRRRLDVNTLTPAMVIRLGNIYNSLSDGAAVPSDYFEIAQPATEGDEKPVSRIEQAVQLLESQRPATNATTITTPFAQTQIIEKARCRACGGVKGEPHGEGCMIDETDEETDD